MKELLFCHDGPMMVDAEGNCYPQSLNQKVLSRYSLLAEQFSLITRTTLVESNHSSKVKLDKMQLRIVECPNLASLAGMFFAQKQVRKILTSAMKDKDSVIIKLPSHIGNLAIPMVRSMKIPYLIELVTCPFDALWNHSWKGRLLAPWMYFMTRHHVKHADFVLYVTDEFLQKRYPAKGTSIGCSDVDLPASDEEVLRQRLRKIDQLDPEKKQIIGTVGAIDVKFKGQQYVIAALGKLKQQGFTNFEYQIVGGGNPSYLNAVACKWNVSDQVKILGSMPHDQIFCWMKQIDCYIQPSRQEGLPRALIEAMSMALPCWGARTAGIPELLDSQCVFGNSSHTSSDISVCLLNFDRLQWKAQAIRNFQKAKQYQASVLDEKRTAFFRAFQRTDQR